jgi:hypothetical protein
MESKKRILVVIALACVFGFSNVSAQCYHPIGFYASQVLLSKPGVSFDLSQLNATEGVIVSERGDILYRSHYHDDIAIRLTNFTFLGESGLDIRLQLPTKEVQTETPYLELELNQTVKVLDLELMGGRNSNWILDLDYRPNPSGGPPIQVSNLTNSNLKVTLMPYQNETYPDTYLRIEVSNTTIINDQNRTSLSNIFDAIGYPVSFETLTKDLQFTEKILVTKDLESALDIVLKEFEWTEAMKTELEWLTKNRVIRGLTGQDIETISELAPYAWGEHRYKTRYYKDGWVLGITEEMITEQYTTETYLPPNCNAYTFEYLPAVIEDFNASYQPFEILFEQSTLGQTIRFGLLGAGIIILILLYVIYRRRR